MAEQTYINIARPYDDNLQRKDDLSYVLGGVITPGSEGGSVEEVSIKTGGSLADLWITKRISSFNWKPKKTGFMMDGQTGYAEFTDVFVSGAITAISGTIGGWSLSSTAIYYDGAGESTSAGMAPATAPFYAGATYANRTSAPFHVTPAGVLYAAGAQITGASSFAGSLSAATGTFAGSLSAASGTFTGSLTAVTGTIGAITLDSSGNIKAGQTGWDSGTGFFLGYSSSIPKFSIGNSAGNKLTWNGTSLSIIGAISGSTITGSDIRTAASGNSVSMQSSAGSEQHALSFYDSGSNVRGRISFNEGTSRIVYNAGSSWSFGGGFYPATDGGYSIGGSGERWGSGYFNAILSVTSNFIVNGSVVLDSARALQNITSITCSGAVSAGNSSFSYLTSTNWIQLYKFIYLGNMTGSAASGETALNGAMYYRSDVGDLRVYLNGGWKTVTAV